MIPNRSISKTVSGVQYNSNNCVEPRDQVSLRPIFLGLIFLILLGSSTGCWGAIGCMAPAVDFKAASEAARIWVEGCLNGDSTAAGKYWSLVSEQVGKNECNSLLKLRKSISKNSGVPGIDYHLYYGVRVISVEEDDSDPCSKGLRVFLERADGRKSGPLAFLVANADSSPNKVVLYAVKPDRLCPMPVDDSQWESFENCFWSEVSSSEPLPFPDVHSVHVFKIDTQSPNLSFEMVMAKDSRNVNEGKQTKSSPREWVREMVARAPYAGRNPVLAFNADYFAGDNDHGPEGLTVKNGKRFDGEFASPPDYDADQLAEDGNTNETNRSSLSISKSNGIRIGQQTDCSKDCFYWPFNDDAYYNTTGGGPLFIDKGERIGGTGEGRYEPCQNEGFSTASYGYCGTQPDAWTAVGVTQDGRYLIVAVGLSQTMDTMAAILKVEGAWQAMKLDGGGSTQLWYKGKEIISDSRQVRQVANAILVFSQ